MDRPLRYSLASLVFRMALAGLFLYAGGQKIPDPHAFQMHIDRFHLVPFWMAGMAAVFLPWLEITCSLGLLTRRFRAGALCFFAMIMVLFTAVILISWARGLDVACGCFGVTEAGATYPWDIARNILLMASFGAVVWFDRKALE